MNKQPFYHEVTILFTGTREFTFEEVQELLQSKLRHKDIVKDSVKIDSFNEPEPGDPADLL